MSFKRLLASILGFLHLGVLLHSHAAHATERGTQHFVDKFHQARYSQALAEFRVKVRDLDVPYQTFGIFVMPGERIPIRPDIGGFHPGFTLETEKGQVLTHLERGSRISWDWTAPKEPGVYPLVIRSNQGQHVHLNMFVMRPAKEIRSGFLGNYKVGLYPTAPLDELDTYRAPKGFIEVDSGNRDVLVSPHFTLGQFLCKQKGGLPGQAYVVLREELLLKLEEVLARVNESGIHATTLHVMSGYRTPSYNQGLGSARFSRHMYGGAADIFVDESPKDGIMDDLNRDGRIDVRDAAVLREIVEDIDGTDQHPHPLVGGLGTYRANRYHGPFIHVDVRGKKARWGVRSASRK
ncbi:MAG: D-Ala-D-Ala carboxypeptidase family metallohydrolase [Nevskiales bacterium]